MTLQETLNGTATALVPVGNLTGLMLLNGRGFKIPCHFCGGKCRLGRFDSMLIGAGINRTTYAETMTASSKPMLFTADDRGTDV